MATVSKLSVALASAPLPMAMLRLPVVSALPAS
jgi:hypothetical protein